MKARVVGRMLVPVITELSQHAKIRISCDQCQRRIRQPGLCRKCSKPKSAVSQGSRPGIEERVEQLRAMYEAAEKMGVTKAEKKGLPTTAGQIPWFS